MPPARAVDRVLHDPSYRRAAERLATGIGAGTATDDAVSELEALADRTAEGDPEHDGTSKPTWT